MPAFIGIDLGTTFSAAAAIDETGRPYIVHNKDGCNLTPSCFEFREDGTHDVGEVARRGLFVPGSSEAWGVLKPMRLWGEPSHQLS